MAEFANLSFLLDMREDKAHINAESPAARINTTMISMCVFSAVLSIVGNVLVITVLLRSFHRHHSISCYKVNLAIADLCIILVFYVPFTSSQAQLGHWVFGGALCSLVLFLQLCCVCSSAYTNVAIGLDRFLAVMYPLEAKPHIQNRWPVIILVWILAGSIACPILVVAKSSHQEVGNFSQATCKEHWTTETQKQIYTLTVFVLVFIVPTAFLSVTYSCVVYTLWSRDTPGNAHAERDRRRLASKKRITRMLIFVVVLFVTCWLPLHVLNIIVDLVPAVLGSLDGHTLDYLYFTCHWVGVSHAFVNPIIYVTTDSDFRNNLWQLLTLRTLTHSLSVSGSTYANIKELASRSLSNSRIGNSSSPISRNVQFSFDTGEDFSGRLGVPAFVRTNNLQIESSKIRKSVSTPNMNFQRQDESSKMLADDKLFQVHNLCEKNKRKRKIHSESYSPVRPEIPEDTEVSDVFFSTDQQERYIVNRSTPV